MDDSEIGALATKEFSKNYPEDRDVVFTDVVSKAFGGALVVVRSIEKNGNPNEELVYVRPADRMARVFKTTEQMAAFLEQKARRPLFVDLMSDKSFVAGCAFALLLFATFIIGFAGRDFGKEALAAITGALGTAAGFFFAARSDKRD